MDQRDLTIVRGLVAVAWADGKVTAQEQEIVDALLDAYAATASEVLEIHKFAAEPRGLSDIEVCALSIEDRRVLLQHAVLLTFADGEQHERERTLIGDLIADLGLSPMDAARVVAAAEVRAKQMLNLLEG